MYSLLLTILGLSSIMASDIENCTKFLEVDTNRIGLYHKYFDSGYGLTDKYLLWKNTSTEMWEMAIGLDDNRNVSLAFEAIFNELNDVKDIHKFDFTADQKFWNCSSKYQIVRQRLALITNCSNNDTKNIDSDTNAVRQNEIAFHPIPSNTSLVIAIPKVYELRYSHKTIAILNDRLEISGLIGCNDICPKFLENMDRKLYTSMQAIVDYNTNGMSGHLVLFTINETLMYCTQEYPSEQHSQMCNSPQDLRPVNCPQKLLPEGFPYVTKGPNLGLIITIVMVIILVLIIVIFGIFVVFYIIKRKIEANQVRPTDQWDVASDQSTSTDASSSAVTMSDINVDKKSQSDQRLVPKYRRYKTDREISASDTTLVSDGFKAEDNDKQKKMSKTSV